MSAIVVSCDRWLGFGAKYVVRVDNEEVGRLGRRITSVRVTVEAGEHQVVVDYNGNRTQPERLDLAESEEARLVLDFGSVTALAVKNSVTPWKDWISQPADQVPPGFMVLNRVD